MRCIELSRPTLGEAPLLELAPTLARGQVASIHRDAESEEVQGPIACCTEIEPSHLGRLNACAAFSTRIMYRSDAHGSITVQPTVGISTW